MTTWNDCGYRFNLSQIIARYVRYDEWKEITAKMQDFTKGGQTAMFVYPPAANGAEFVNEPLYQTIFYDRVRKRKMTSDQELLVTILKRAEKISIGLNAVYKVYHMLHNTDYSVGMEGQFARKISKYAENVLRMGALASYNRPDHYEPYIEQCKPKIEQSYNKYGKVHRQVQQLITYHRQKEYLHRKRKWTPKDEYPTYGYDLGIYQYKVIHAGGILLFCRSQLGKLIEVHALDYVSQSRLHQLSASFFYTHLYCNIYEVTFPESRVYRAAEAYLDMVFERLETCTHIQAQIVCKSLKKAYDVFLATIAGKANRDSAIELVKEFKANEWNELFPLERIFKICFSVPIGHCMEIARLFKVLPAPDYDLGESFAELYRKHQTPSPYKDPKTPYRPKTKDRQIEEPTMEGVRLYMRFLWIAHHIEKKHKPIGKVKDAYSDEPWAKEYEMNGKMPSITDLSWCDKIDLTGTAQYIEDTEDSVLQLKDKVLCYDRLDDNLEITDSAPLMKSQVTRLLIDSQIKNFMPDPALKFEHVHKVAPKPESHKDVARLFFIGNLRGRRTLAEFEHNIGWICKEMTGYAIGKGTKEVKELMHKLSKIPEGMGAIFLNTDVKGWSPQMNEHIQKLPLDFFSEVFGKSEIKEYYKIWMGSTIVINKNNYIDHYVNKHANFEGYNGKMLTFMHLAVIAYATRIARQTVPELSPADLAVFIDDCAARVLCPKELLDRVTPIYYRSLLSVYDAVGLELDRFKSILSNHLSVFLNEIYMNGAHLTYGSRAAVKLGTIIRHGTDTIVDMIEASKSAAEGCIKAGSPHYLAYTLLVVNLAWLHHKWDPVTDITDTKFAFFQFAPRAFGGYGIPTVFTLSTNLASNPVTEGIAILQEISFYYKDFRPVFKRILDVHLISKTNTQILLNPGGVATNRPIINSGRTERALMNVIKRRFNNSAIKEVLSSAFEISWDKVADQIVEINEVIDAYTMIRFSKATPFELLRSVARKFKSSMSIKQMLGNQKVGKIARANKIDVLKVNHHIKKT